MLIIITAANTLIREQDHSPHHRLQLLLTGWMGEIIVVPLPSVLFLLSKNVDLKQAPQHDRPTPMGHYNHLGCSRQPGEGVYHSRASGEELCGIAI